MQVYDTVTLKSCAKSAEFNFIMQNLLQIMQEFTTCSSLISLCVHAVIYFNSGSQKNEQINTGKGVIRRGHSLKVILKGI